MSGTLIVNNLSGLLIVTSLLVIGAKRPATSALLYALQSSVLVLIFLVMAHTMQADELYLWSATAFATKVVLVPYLMYRALGSMSDSIASESVLSPAWSVLAAALIVVLSLVVVSSVQIPAITDLKPALGVSLGHFFLGLMCIVTQRNILKQVFGYCLMENGAHLTLALMANKAPELVEVGIATDAIFAVVIMIAVARQIHRTMNTLDVRQLTALKG